jgi:uncharacterized protein YukE
MSTQNYLNSHKVAVANVERLEAEVKKLRKSMGQTEQMREELAAAVDELHKRLEGKG